VLLFKNFIKLVLVYLDASALKVVSSESLGGSKVVLFDGYGPRIVALNIIVSI
jgi:hypothetical protein